ncbi:MAG: 30S ribosomal protein S17 [Nanoarchaeota archaeon]
MKKSIGIGIEAPNVECKDKKCPFHGNLSVRGRSFTGNVVKADAYGTICLEWLRLVYMPKYERYEKRRSRIKAHNPKCISAKVGDKVVVMECRPLSKTKHFVVVRKIK